MRCFPSMFWPLVFGELQYPVCCVIWNSAPPLNIFYRTAGPHISIILLYFKPQLFRRSWLRFSSPGARWTVLGQRLVEASNQSETRGAPSFVRPPLLSPDALSPDRSYPRWAPERTAEIACPGAASRVEGSDSGFSVIILLLLLCLSCVLFLLFLWLLLSLS